MSSAVNESPSDPNDLICRALSGDQQALAALFDQYRHRLGQMVRLRLDRRLQGRVDPSDVVQEAYLDVAQQLPSYVEKREDLSFFLWLRMVTGQRMMRVHRQHLGAEMRDARREVSLHRGALPRATSVSLAAQLLGRFTSVSQAAMRAELQVKLQEAINSMEEVDREIIALRHFEELTNKETAELLGLSKTAASNRYVRAMARLQSVLQSLPGFFDQFK
jgi:RNA polymerase sigma-70 factor (ECF subfamily)